MIVFVLAIFDFVTGTWTEGFVISGFLSLFLLFILFSMVKSGIDLNNMFAIHRDALLKVQIEIRNVLSQSEEEQLPEFNMIKQNL